MGVRTNCVDRVVFVAALHGAALAAAAAAADNRVGEVGYEVECVSSKSKKKTFFVLHASSFSRSKCACEMKSNHHSRAKRPLLAHVKP